MVRFSFITILYYQNIGLLKKKYDTFTKEQIEQNEFIFILNRFKSKTPLLFDINDKNNLKRYDVKPELIAVAQKLNARFLVPTSNGLAIARNEGASFAKNDYFIFTDEDIIPSKEWYKSIANFFMEKNGDICFGPDDYHNEKGLWTWWRNQYELHFSTRNQVKQKTRVTISNFFSCAGRNLAMKSSAFKSLGGYDVAFDFRFGEDLDLLIRAVQSKHLVWFLPNMKVQHIHPISFYGLLRKFWMGGRADANWVLHHKSKMELNKAGKHYFSPFDLICILVALFLFFLNIIIGIVFLMTFGLTKCYLLMKKRNPSPTFVLVSTLLIPIKTVLTMGGFFQEIFEHSFLNKN